MGQFQYVPFDPSSLIPSIAALMARQNDPYAQAAQLTAAGNARAADSIAAGQAHAAEVSGDVWGRTIANIGQIPNQVMAQTRENANADQMRKLRQSEIDKNAQAVAAQNRAAQGQQLIGSLLPQFTKPDPVTGLNDVDHDGLAAAFVAKGGDPSAMEKYLQSASATSESLEKIRASKRQDANALAEAVGRQAQDATSPADFLTRIDHLTVAGAIPAAVRQQFAQEIQQAGPDGWDATKKRYVDWADSVVKPITLKEGESVLSGVSHAPIATATAKPKTEGELDAAAEALYAKRSTGQPLTPQEDAQLKGYEERKRGQAPGSLDEQLLQAVKTGDMDAANQITQTMKAAAAAKGDPAAIAAANRQAATIAAQIAQQGRAQAFTEAQAGRGELTNKVEAPYLDAREKADTLRSVVALAKSGNKEAANVQGLLGVLGLVTSEGVKRINTTELDQVQGAGSLFDKIKSRAGSIVSGQPIPADLQNDLVQLSDMLEQSARKKYEQGFKTVKTRYGLKDETAIAPSGSPDKGTTRTVGGKAAVWDYRNDQWGWWPQ